MVSLTKAAPRLRCAPALRAQEGYTEKADIWSLGCVLYHMCMLRGPFEGSNPLQVRAPDAPKPRRLAARRSYPLCICACACALRLYGPHAGSPGQARCPTQKQLLQSNHGYSHGTVSSNMTDTELLHRRP